ncbi:sugar phosphate isomerase/epimerase family protein [Bacteroidota bacterium]
MNRRNFTKKALFGTMLMSYASLGCNKSNDMKKNYVRLGGQVFDKYNDPGAWIQSLKKYGYRAAYCPVGPDTPDDDIEAYRKTAEQNDIVISEVGAWSNPISPDETMRKEAIEKCTIALELAEKIQANCCVNISGSLNLEQWAGPHKDNLNDDTFNLVVETTRKIIDSVNPTRTFFALEPMPWAFPYSPDSYLRLVKAMDRSRFGVHFDPVNMVTSPYVLFNNGEMIKEAFKILGPHIRSCHAKDVYIKEDIYMPNINEIRPGLGTLDYATFLTELSKLKDIPLMMEHLNTQEEYNMAADYIRSVGKKVNIDL